MKHICFNCRAELAGFNQVMGYESVYLCHICGTHNWYPEEDGDNAKSHL